MMQTDVKSIHITGSGTVLTERTRVRGVIYLGDGVNGGEVIFKDGDASAPALIQFNAPNSAATTLSVLIPGNGVLFETGVYIVAPTGGSTTVFYG